MPTCTGKNVTLLLDGIEVSFESEVVTKQPTNNWVGKIELENESVIYFTEDEYLEGEIISSVTGLNVGSEEIIFTTESGKAIKLYHNGECCESVDVEDIEGSHLDLVGGKVWLAEEVEGEVNATDWGDQMYTFYKIETDKGGVWIRWNGESNGYYSIGVATLGGIIKKGE